MILVPCQVVGKIDILQQGFYLSLKAECSVYFLTQELVITSINIFDGGNDDFLQDLDDNLICRRVKPPVSMLNLSLLKD